MLDWWRSLRFGAHPWRQVCAEVYLDMLTDAPYAEHSGVPSGFPLRCLLRDRGKGDWDDRRLPPPEHTHSHHASQKNSAPSRRLRQRMDLSFMRTSTRIVIPAQEINVLTAFPSRPAHLLAHSQRRSPSKHKTAPSHALSAAMFVQLPILSTTRNFLSTACPVSSAIPVTV